MSKREMFFDWNASRLIYLGVYVVSPLPSSQAPPRPQRGHTASRASGIFGNSLREAVYTARIGAA